MGYVNAPTCYACHVAELEQLVDQCVVLYLFV